MKIKEEARKCTLLYMFLFSKDIIHHMETTSKNVICAMHFMLKFCIILTRRYIIPFMKSFYSEYWQGRILPLHSPKPILYSCPLAWPVIFTWSPSSKNNLSTPFSNVILSLPLHVISNNEPYDPFSYLFTWEWFIID